MVQISNKPNISGIKDVSEDAEYSSKLLAREGKLFAGLITTRFKGFAFGIGIERVAMLKGISSQKA